MDGAEGVRMLVSWPKFPQIAKSGRIINTRMFFFCFVHELLTPEF